MDGEIQVVENITHILLYQTENGSTEQLLVRSKAEADNLITALMLARDRTWT